MSVQNRRLGPRKAAESSSYLRLVCFRQEGPFAIWRVNAVAEFGVGANTCGNTSGSNAAGAVNETTASRKKHAAPTASNSRSTARGKGSTRRIKSHGRSKFVSGQLLDVSCSRAVRATALVDPARGTDNRPFRPDWKGRRSLRPSVWPLPLTGTAGSIRDWLNRPPPPWLPFCKFAREGEKPSIDRVDVTPLPPLRGEKPTAPKPVPRVLNVVLSDPSGIEGSKVHLPSGRYERSSTGRAPVSKTGGWGFDSLRSCCREAAWRGQWRRVLRPRSCRAREVLVRQTATELPGPVPERLRIKCHG